MEKILTENYGPDEATTIFYFLTIWPMSGCHGHIVNQSQNVHFDHSQNSNSVKMGNLKFDHEIGSQVQRFTYSVAMARFLEH